MRSVLPKYQYQKNINKEMEIIKRSQIEILEKKITITKVKNSLDRFNSRYDQAEERIGKFKDKSITLSNLMSGKKKE